MNNAGYIGVEWTEEFVSAVKTTGAVVNIPFVFVLFHCVSVM